MNFFDTVFFVKICDIGISEAKREFSLDQLECDEIISSLQTFLDDPLFLDLKNPSVENLTRKGKAFFPGAKKIVTDLFSDFLKEEENSEDRIHLIKVNADILSGKNIALPAVTRLENYKRYPGINIELFTCEDYERLENINMHVMFHSMRKTDKIFFDKKWSVRIEQGLYASKRYLHESGNIPQTVEDLLNHAVIGIGDSFDQEVYSYTNWHLSESYMGVSIVPAVMISSSSVLIAAVEANLGIGPIMEYQDITENENLCRILPEIEGPPTTIDFAVRKNLNKKYDNCIRDIEEEILLEIKNLGLEVAYQ